MILSLPVLFGFLIFKHPDHSLLHLHVFLQPFTCLGSCHFNTHELRVLKYKILIFWNTHASKHIHIACTMCWTVVHHTTENIGGTLIFLEMFWTSFLFQQTDKLKAENAKLKEENRALTRVVSKLSKIGNWLQTWFSYPAVQHGLRHFHMSWWAYDYIHTVDIFYDSRQYSPICRIEKCTIQVIFYSTTYMYLCLFLFEFLPN